MSSHTFSAGSLVRLLRVYIQRNDQVETEGLFETLRRGRIIAVLTIAINLSYALIFWLDEAGSGSTPLAMWTRAIAMTHIVCAAVNVMLVAGVHGFLVRGEQSKSMALALVISFCLAGLGFGIALSVIDQLVSPNTTNFSTMALLVGLIPLIRPRLAFAIFLPAYLIFFMVLPITQTDPLALAMARSHGFSGAIMSLTVSWLVWHQYAKSVLLRRELTDANAMMEQQQKELVFLATRDSLTGLYVRREFARLTQMELARAVRQKTSTALVMVDLDHFKQVNDQYGHPAGDEVLQRVAKILTAGLRATDVIGRMGGEEFAILLPDTSRDEARAVAEKLRLALRAEPLPAAGHLLPITASLGISITEPTSHASFDALYGAADDALYAAKQGGRDRVEFSAPAKVSPGGTAPAPADSAGLVQQSPTDN